MSHSNRIHSMVLSALLIAVGILIPILSPVKVMIEPMSFTLASHVAIMIAMYVSPSVAVATACGTTLGFLLYGFPMPVVLRALSHIVWAFVGGIYLRKHPDTLNSMWKTVALTVAIALIHAAAEVAIVIPIYFNDPNIDFMYMVMGLVGVGTIVHSIVDMIISIVAWKVLVKNRSIVSVSNVKEVALQF